MLGFLVAVNSVLGVAIAARNLYRTVRGCYNSVRSAYSRYW